MKILLTLSPRDAAAVLFDPDGVRNKTARVHAAAWKKLFDGFLEQRPTKGGKGRYMREHLPKLKIRIVRRSHALATAIPDNAAQAG